MATLRDDGLSLEFVFKEVDDCLWLKYEIYFRWDDEHVFRDELLKRSPAGWAGRSKGALCANAYAGDSFLPVLEEAINAVEPICWEPAEPDILISFYPDQPFPMIPDRRKVAYTNDILKQREERRQRKIANNGRLTDDVITMIVYVDAYNFRRCSLYYGTGFAMVLSPTRAQLAAFYKQPKREYDAFVVRERLAERIGKKCSTGGKPH